MLKQGHRKLCRTIQQKVIQHCTVVRNKNTLNTESPIYAIGNLALGTKRRTTKLPSCWNRMLYLPFPWFFITLASILAPLPRVYSKLLPTKKATGLGAGFGAGA